MGHSPSIEALPVQWNEAGKELRGMENMGLGGPPCSVGQLASNSAAHQ